MRFELSLDVEVAAAHPHRAVGPLLRCDLQQKHAKYRVRAVIC